MSILTAEGKPAEAPKEEVKPDAKQEAPEMPEEASLTIDKLGNLVLFIPLHKTREVLSRGIIDMCRTESLKWYVANAQKMREIQALANKTGFQRVKDKLVGK